MITKITFKDGRTWPELPDKRPARSGDDPVNGIALGVIGEGERAQPAYALFNFGKQDVKNVSMAIEYLDADGKVVGSTSTGYSSNKSIIDSGKELVFSSGDGPPEGAVNARIKMTRVTFIDDTWWPATAKGPDFSEMKKLIDHIRSKKISIENVDYEDGDQYTRKLISEGKMKPSGYLEASLSGIRKDTFYDFNILEFADEKKLLRNMEYNKKGRHDITRNGRFVLKVYRSENDGMELIAKEIVTAFESYKITK